MVEGLSPPGEISKRIIIQLRGRIEVLLLIYNSSINFHRIKGSSFYKNVGIYDYIVTKIVFNKSFDSHVKYNLHQVSIY